MTLRALSTGLFAACLSLSAAAQSDGGQEGASAGTVTVEEAAAAPESWRKVDPENLIVMETSAGRILIEIFDAAAPAHGEQFRGIVRSGKYAGVPFHRVIDDFMAQGGDILGAKGEPSGFDNLNGEFTFRRTPSDMPLNTIGPANSSRGGLYNGFPIATQAQFLAEMTKDGTVESWIPHCPGVVSTARTDDPNSANSQFFLMRGRAEHLDREYTAWGRVVDGLDAVLAIQKGPAPNGVPIAQPDRIESAAMAADMAEGERPVVYVQRTDTEAWAQKLETADRDDAHICDVERASSVVG